VSELPEGWAEATLNTLTSKIGSGATPRGGSEIYELSGVPLIRSQNVHFDGFTEQGLVYLNSAQASALDAAKVQSCDVLLNITGASIGRVCLAPRHMDGSRVNQHVAIVRPLPGVLLPQFLALYLRAPAVQTRIHSEEYGVTRQALTKAWISELQVPVPPLAEQRCIVEKAKPLLEATLKLSTHAGSASDRLRRLDDSLANAAADGSLINEPCPSHAALTEFLEEPLANGRSVVDDLAGFPVLRLNAITRRGIDLTQRKLGAWTADEARRFLVRKNDFLVSRGNGSLKLVGRGALVHDEPDPVAYPDTLIRVRTDQKKLDPKYLEIVWNSRAVRDQIEAAARTTAGIHKISQRDLERIEIPYAKPEMQQLIIRRHAALVRVCDVATTRVEAVQARAEKVRQSILAKAFAGELVPTEAEVARLEGRSYEPASMLLQRIRRTAGSAPATRRSR
jgi:type I restriction enzyme, S subunit